MIYLGLWKQFWIVNSNSNKEKGKFFEFYKG